MSEQSVLHDLVAKNEAEMLQRWVDRQLAAASYRSDRISKVELSDQSRRFLSLFRQSISSGSADIYSPAWTNTRQMLEELSVSRARQGFSPSETAGFVFSLKETLFARVRIAADDPPRVLPSKDGVELKLRFRKAVEAVG